MFLSVKSKDKIIATQGTMTPAPAGAGLNPDDKG
jgi:hypothetical protein